MEAAQESINVEKATAVVERGAARFWGFLVPEDTAPVAAAKATVVVTHHEVTPHQVTPYPPVVSQISIPTYLIALHPGGAGVKAE